MANKLMGASHNVMTTLGASNHADEEREKLDFYATDPKSVQLFLDQLSRDNITLPSKMWEPCCGEGDISKVLIANGFDVISSDLIDRGYGLVQDFLDDGFNRPTLPEGVEVILTNPPFKYAVETIEQAIRLLPDNGWCIMFLRTLFLESQERYRLFQKYPIKYVYIHSSRQTCLKNGWGNTETNAAGAMSYSWFMWNKGYKGETTLRFIA